jgi:hypothetical protein
MSKVLAIQLFLERIKNLALQGKIVFQPRNRKKSRDFLLKYGFTVEDINAVLNQLEPKHYSKGPEDDHDGSEGSVYVFLCQYEGLNIYIKAKIVIDSNGDNGIILSFHEEGMYD